MVALLLPQLFKEGLLGVSESKAPLYKGSRLAVALAEACLKGCFILFIYPSASLCSAPFSRGVRNVTALGHRSGGLLPSLISQFDPSVTAAYAAAPPPLGLGEAWGCPLF